MEFNAGAGSAENTLGWKANLGIAPCHWVVLGMVTEGRQGLQDVEGNESYLVEAVATLPPPLG